ncbi:hypothetical protein D3C87_2042610 [compost metagenome]
MQNKYGRKQKLQQYILFSKAKFIKDKKRSQHAQANARSQNRQPQVAQQILQRPFKNNYHKAREKQASIFATQHDEF